MTHAIEPLVGFLELPPGAFGPHAVTIEVRQFLVPTKGRVVIVDAGPPGSVGLTEEGLGRLGATWSDVSDIVLTHRHFDHVGGLGELAARAAGATVWAGSEDAGDIPFASGQIRTLGDGDMVGPLRVVHTPGHTPGHVSLLHEADSIVLAGDVVGSRDGTLTWGPPAFTADAGLQRASLERLAGLHAGRMLFSHGSELPDPETAIVALLNGEVVSPP